MLFGAVSDDQIQRVYRFRVAFFFVLVVTIVAALFLIYQFTQTLYHLHLAEGERDRWRRSDHGESREIQMQQYQIAASVAEDEIRQRGFEVLSRDNRFIDRPAVERPGDRQDDHVWWLIVARKP
jgi:hypothetical protein